MPATLAEKKAVGFPIGSGFLDVMTPADPAAGANLTLDAGQQRYLVVRSVYVELTTSGVAANRYLNVDYRLGQKFFVVRNAATVLVTASSTSQPFQFDNQHTVSEWNTGTTIYAPLLPLALPSGFVVRLTVDAIDTTDQLANCRVVVERYYDDGSLSDDDLY